MTKKRQVFGRVKVVINGAKYKIELHGDGTIWIRRKHARYVARLQPVELLRLAQPQTELFVLKQEETAA